MFDIFPGMVDLHVHAPQYAFCGMCMDLELMEWLNRYTFPKEEKYENPEYAEKAYGMFVAALEKGATTRACILSTRHRYATELLMKLMDDSVLVHPQSLNLAERMERAVYLGLDEKKITAKYIAGRKIL